MCGRYVLAQKIEVIEKRFNAKATEGYAFEANYNISPGNIAPVITSDKPREIQLFRFGMTPFFAKKPMYLFNARAEGDSNKENNPDYKGGKGIIKKPAFRKPIRSQRCLVIADCFIEGTTNEGLSKPFVVYLRNKVRPFAFAGIWDTWQNHETNEIINSFAIITTVANSLIQMLPHHRSPVVLSRSDERRWINQNSDLSTITALLKPYPAEKMNAYPVSSRIKPPKANDAKLLRPAGERLLTETEQSLKTNIEMQGMGNRKRREGESLEDRISGKNFY